MAAALGRTNPSVEEMLLQFPWDFEFFQAVRLLALMDPDPKGRPISRFRQPLEESVRFHAHRSMAFPPSAIQDLTERTEKDGHLHMTVNFLGLTGPMGILPAHYTEYLIARSYVGDNAAAAFFDLFNHRLISLFYLAWEKHHFPIAYERESRRPDVRKPAVEPVKLTDDAAAGEPFDRPKAGAEPIPPATQSRFTRYLFDLIGMGTAGLQRRLEMADSVLLSYCGLIAQRPHSAIALAGVLRDYFRVPIEIEQFVGEWSYLEQEDLSYLGGSSVSSQLGCGAVAGRHVWNSQARFRIRVGPLTWGRFQSFLPGGSTFRELVALARHFVNQAMDFEVQCILLAGEVPWCRASGDPDSPRLGLSSWLKTGAFPKDAADLVLAVRSSGELK